MKNICSIQDIADFELIEDMLKEVLRTTSFKNLETLSYLRRSLTLLTKLKNRFENTWTVDETATFLGCSKKTVYRLIKTGKLKAVKDGKFYAVFESSINTNKNKIMKKEKIVSIETLEALGLIKGGNKNV